MEEVSLLQSRRRSFCLVGIVWLLASVLRAQAGEVTPVRHSPVQPHSGEPVQITASVTQAVTGVALEYQIVEPGRYIELKDPAYQKNWVPITMSPAGRSK